MAKTTTQIETNSVVDIIDSWTKFTNDFDSNKPTVFTSNSSSGFFRIRDAGFSTDSIQKYDTNVENLILTLRNFKSVINDYLDIMVDADTDIESKLPTKDGVILDTATKSTSINVDDKVNEISSSSMRDLEKEANELNKTKETQYASLKLNEERIKQILLRKLYSRLSQNPEFDDSNYRISRIELENINKAFGAMINNGELNYSISRKDLREFANKYMKNSFELDDSRFHNANSSNDTSSKFHNANFKNMSNNSSMMRNGQF